MAKQATAQIKKMLVKLNDASGSFTDPTQNITISGDGVHEVEPSIYVIMSIQGRGLIQLSELEEKAYYAEKEANEVQEAPTEETETKEKKGKKA